MSVTRERQHRNVTQRRDPESKVLRLELLDLLNLFAPLLLLMSGKFRWKLPKLEVADINMLPCLKQTTVRELMYMKTAESRCLHSSKRCESTHVGDERVICHWSCTEPTPGLIQASISSRMVFIRSSYFCCMSRAFRSNLEAEERCETPKLRDMTARIQTLH